MLQRGQLANTGDGAVLNVLHWLCLVAAPALRKKYFVIWIFRENRRWGNPPVKIESSWNAMAHGDAREGKWRGNWRLEWVASTLHTTSEHGVSIITTAYALISAASSRLNWRPCQFKRTRPFRRKTKFGFCACAITFQTQYTNSCSLICLENFQRSVPWIHKITDRLSIGKINYWNMRISLE